MTFRLFLRVSSCLLAVALLASAALAASPGRDGLPPEFQSLQRKSIFARDRSRPRTERAPSSQPAPASQPAPVALPVLVGILAEETGPVALVESPADGTLTALHLGQTMPGPQGGLVVAMTLDYLEIAGGEDAPVRRVWIGQDLQGSAVTWSVPTSPTPPAAAASSDSSAPASGGGDVLERLRRRRQQELNR